MSRFLNSVLLFQLVAIAGFIWFGWQADQVMGKDGIGDLELWSQYNNQAGIAIYIAVACWLVVITVAIASKSFRSRQAQMAIGLPPLAAVFGWIALWMI